MAPIATIMVSFIPINLLITGTPINIAKIERVL